jgi:beta-lactamase superfamily II metal-dependent hydrolase
VSDSELAVLNVGQGDCVVVRDPASASAAVIDCPGHAPNAPLAYLEDHRVERLCGVIVTHLHDDHYGGIPTCWNAGVLRHSSPAPTAIF